MAGRAVILFREYMGTGLIVIWYALSLGYLFCREKRSSERVLFVYAPAVLLVLFFNPFFEEMVYRVVGEDIYYRILWLIPIAPSIAYAVSDIYGRLRGRAQVLFAFLAAALIAISGSFIYANPYFHRAQNWYHVPQSVVNICDAIEIEGREVMAVFPKELLQFVRQYSEVICMPYGRETLVDRWGYWNELYGAMEAEVIDAEQLAELARRESCVYIILPLSKEMKGRLEDYDFAEFTQTDGYRVYRDAYFLSK